MEHLRLIIVLALLVLTGCSMLDLNAPAEGQGLAGGDEQVTLSQTDRPAKAKTQPVMPRPPLPSTGVLTAAWADGNQPVVLDATDRIEAIRAELRTYSAPIGQKITWRNPQTDHSGTLSPVRDGYASNGTYCRDFFMTLTSAGQTGQTYVKACQQPDGSWKRGR